VLQRFVKAEETNDGVHSLVNLWKSVENLADESQVAVVYTRNLEGATHGSLCNQAGRISQLMGKDDEAGPLDERSLAIGEESLGRDHPDVAVALNNWTGWLQT
ncbi:unnamed protein product, partial [Ectocarpus sp. 13 AM-2016]